MIHERSANPTSSRLNVVKKVRIWLTHSLWHVVDEFDLIPDSCGLDVSTEHPDWIGLDWIELN